MCWVELGARDNWVKRIETSLKRSVNRFTQWRPFSPHFSYIISFLSDRELTYLSTVSYIANLHFEINQLYKNNGLIS